MRVTSGKSWALCQVEHIGEDENKGKIEMYGWSDSSQDGRFGKDPKVIYNDKFIMLGSQVNHADIVHFDCSREATYLILQKKIDMLPSIVADKPEYRGLVHFFKQKGTW